jgi:hypothetical protein
VRAYNAGGFSPYSSEATAVTTKLTGTGEIIFNGDFSASGTYNLTTEGTLDWAVWGRSVVGDFDHKATGGTKISNWTALGTGHSPTTTRP